MGKGKRTVSNFKVDILDAKGGVESTICEAVKATDNLELIARLDSGDGLDELVTAGVQTIVNFTQPDSVMGNLKLRIKNDISAVVGTTGFTKERLDQVQRWLDNADGDADALIVSSFAISAVLTMKMAELAAPYFDLAGVIETHHPLKGDTLSGATIHTVETIAHVRKEAGMGEQPDATEQILDGAHGVEVEGIPACAVRMTGSVVHGTVILSAKGQSFTTKRGSYPCTSLIPGVLLDVRKAEDFLGLTVGLESFLGL